MPVVFTAAALVAYSKYSQLRADAELGKTLRTATVEQLTSITANMASQKASKQAENNSRLASFLNWFKRGQESAVKIEEVDENDNQGQHNNSPGLTYNN